MESRDVAAMRSFASHQCDTSSIPGLDVMWVEFVVRVCVCNLFTHEAPKSSRNSFKGVRAFQVELEFRNVGFCGGRKTGEPKKNLQSRDENQQQTQPTYDVESGNRTRATLVRGECSHHCAIPAPLVLAPRGFHPGSLVFPSPHKPTFPNSNSI